MERPAEQGAKPDTPLDPGASDPHLPRQDNQEPHTAMNASLPRPGMAAAADGASTGVGTSLVGPAPVADERARARKRARREKRLVRRAEEARWVAAIIAGDKASFRKIVDRYQRQIYWIAFDILLDTEEARDVTQETFVRVHAAMDRFDPKRDLVNWICRIARNLAIDALRRRRRHATPTEDLTQLADDAEVAAVATPGRRDQAARVREVLAELPVEYRLVLTLREFHGMAPREIAQVTDCSYPTARWRLHRARKLFRMAWEERFGVLSPVEGHA